MNRLRVRKLRRAGESGKEGEMANKAIRWWTCFFGHSWGWWESRAPGETYLLQFRRCSRCGKWQQHLS